MLTDESNTKVRRSMIECVLLFLCIFYVIAPAAQSDEHHPENSQLIDSSAQHLQNLNDQIQFNPANGEAYHQRGLVQECLGRYKEAIADLTKAMELLPITQWDDLYHARSVAYGMMGNWERSISDATHAIALNPKDALSLQNRALSRLELKQNEAACKDLIQAINLDPSQSTFYQPAGEACYRTGRYSTALTYLNRAIALDARDGDAYYYRGMTYRQLHNYEQANKDLDRAKSLGYNPISGTSQGLKLVPGQ